MDRLGRMGLVALSTAAMCSGEGVAPPPPPYHGAMRPMNHHHPYSQGHTPLASFKHPDRPLEQVKQVMDNLKHKVHHLTSRLDRRRRQEVLRQLEAEMNFHRQARAQAAAGPEGSGEVTPPSQPPQHDLAPEEILTVFLDTELNLAGAGDLSRALKAHDHRRPVRRFVTYGHWLVDAAAFFVKVLAVVLFQVVGTGLAINEYQRTGVITNTLMEFSGVLAGLAFVPPMVVALRHALPRHNNNPIVRFMSRVIEIALDVMVVSALSLFASIVLTALFSMTSYSALLSRSLSDEYIVGALSASFIFAFIWAFSRQFDSLSLKWFM